MISPSSLGWIGVLGVASGLKILGSPERGSSCSDECSPISPSVVALSDIRPPQQSASAGSAAKAVVNITGLIAAIAAKARPRLTYTATLSFFILGSVLVVCMFYLD